MGREIPYEPVEQTRLRCIAECKADKTLTAIGRARCILSCSIFTTN